jgi:DNA-binding NarL/FixJ family response regulator
LNTSLIRVLVVDDFEPWRLYASTTVQSRPELRIVGQASDGLEAVQKAQELQPDLILLDIGLPTLNGIEAAKQICEKVPDAKILFCSENRSWDIAEEGLRIGAGYVLKSEAGKDLLPAVEAVLRGDRFLSSAVARHDPYADKEDTADNNTRKKLIAPLPPENVLIRHEVEFYPDDAGFVDGFARTIETILDVGNVAILIATASHRTEILGKLKAAKVDVDAAKVQRRYIELDADQTLTAIMINDLPDPTRCAKIMADLITSAKEAQGNSGRIAICGECAPTLLARGNSEGAILLEHLWNKITSKYRVDTLCGYSSSACPENDLVFQRICAEHSAVQGRDLGY